MTYSNRVDFVTGFSVEQRELVHRQARAAARMKALGDARLLGPVMVPLHWPRTGSERYLPQTNAYVATTWLRLPRLQVPAMRFADALDEVRAAGASASSSAPGTRLDPRDRLAEHQLDAWRSRTTGVQPHPVASTVEPSVGTPLAVVEATGGATGRRWQTRHVVRMGEPLGDRHATPDDACAAARAALVAGDADVPLGVVGHAGGQASVVRLRLPAGLVDHEQRDPLVGAVAGTGATLAWDRSTIALRAVVGLDGVRWF